ncbi:7-cyano-7-deazaguanine synthase [[Mycobacterium] zoologicum]|uniref:7-cyano-7-deazaguanine synthase n=1 Tax=[Mycobacterium] zoologicum TaxID=2872311 RepID=UPI002B9A899B|nr:7-cyano-7-deazaguanine synthase [Mycolicibacter sp. MYC101]MEB3065719.1 7-cyano-7-deazaguanine synthase [Mycolicibacter sp. MYC101]
MNAPPDTLLMLSGGIDSAFCLWQRVQAGLPTRTHHVHFQNSDNRADAEAAAVADILEWLARNGGHGLITHTASRLDHGDLALHGLWDGFMLAFWAGAILHADPFIASVIVGVQADDAGPRDDVRDQLFWRIAANVGRRQFWLSHPARSLTKRDIIAAMPPELVDLCWSCRRPQDGHPCHSCHTCRLVDAARGVRP